MIKFRQRSFSEHTAMNYFYDKLMKSGGDRRKWTIIDRSSLLPILRGNNVVIEKFNIVDSWFGGDTYRMYIKIGAKANLPDNVRMPRGRAYDHDLGRVKLQFSNPGFREFSSTKLFADNNNNNNNNGGAFGKMNWEAGPSVSIKYRETGNQLGKTIEYDKDTRSLVLEFKRIDDAIECLNYLPFGFGYKIYLLDSK